MALTSLQAYINACCKNAGGRHSGESAPDPAGHSTCPHEKRALAAYDRAATDGLPLVAVLFWVRGMLMNMSWPVYNQLAVEGIPSRDKPLVVGWMSVSWSLAWLGGSIIGGRLATTSYTAGYFVTAGLYAVGAILSWLLLRRVTLAKEPSAVSLAAESAEPRA